MDLVMHAKNYRTNNDKEYRVFFIADAMIIYH